MFLDEIEETEEEPEEEADPKPSFSLWQKNRLHVKNFLEYWKKHRKPVQLLLFY